MESGVIVRWLKQEGDSVSKGEPLYELDTDKVTQEVEAEVDGVLQKIVVAEGEVDVGATIAVIETNEHRARIRVERRRGGEAGGTRATSSPRQRPRRNRSPLPTPRQRPRGERPGAGRRRGEADGPGVSRRHRSRAIARERGVDLASLTGTGPEAASSPRTSSARRGAPLLLRPAPQPPRPSPHRARSRSFSSHPSGRRSRGASPRRGRRRSSSWASPPT